MSPSSPRLINAAVTGPGGTCVSSWLPIQGQVWQWTVSTKDHVGFYGLCGYGVYILSHGPKGQTAGLLLLLQSPNRPHSSFWDSPFVLMAWLAPSNKGRTSPGRDTGGKAVRAADQLRGNSSHQHTWGPWGPWGSRRSTARGRNVAHGPYTAMPDPAHTQGCRCVPSFYQVSYYHSNAPNLRFRTV